MANLRGTIVSATKDGRIMGRTVSKLASGSMGITVSTRKTNVIVFLTKDGLIVINVFRSKLKKKKKNLIFSKRISAE